MYLNRAWSVWCLIALGLSCAAGRAEDLKLSLSLDHNQREFHIGEPIYMHLAFTTSVPETYGVQGQMPQRRYDAGLEEVVISPSDGWVDPWAAYREAARGSFVESGLNSYGLPSSKPYEVILRLDAYVRFQNPGRYAVEVISTRASHADAGPTPEPVRLVSNSVSFVTLPASPEWQQERLQHGLALLNGDNPQNEAYEWVQTVDTTPAAAAMILRTATDTHPGADYFFANGLLRSSRRQYIIDSTKQKISDPGFAVRSYFVDTLAELMVLQDGVSREFLDGKSETMRQLRDRLVATLPGKHATAKAITLSSLIDCTVGPCPEPAEGRGVQLPPICCWGRRSESRRRTLLLRFGRALCQFQWMATQSTRDSMSVGTTAAAWSRSNISWISTRRERCSNCKAPPPHKTVQFKSFRPILRKAASG